MSKFMKNARSWLGLGQDPYYDVEYGDPDLDDDVEHVDDDVVDVTPSAHEHGPSAAARHRVSSHRRPAGAPTSVRSVPSSPQTGDADDGDGGVRVITQAPGASDVEAGRGVVRPLPVATRPHVVSPKNFNDVQAVADTYKRAQPVIVNLQDVDRDLSRRLIDFCSGLCYGLEGNMERVTDQVFLLTPSGAEVSDEDRRRIREGALTDDGR